MCVCGGGGEFPQRVFNSMDSSELIHLEFTLCGFCQKKWGFVDQACPTQCTDAAFNLTTLFHANLILRKCYISTKDSPCTADDRSLKYSELCEVFYSAPWLVQDDWKSKLPFWIFSYSWVFRQKKKKKKIEFELEHRIDMCRFEFWRTSWTTGSFPLLSLIFLSSER